jgi:hypothetical protein
LPSNPRPTRQPNLSPNGLTEVSSPGSKLVISRPLPQNTEHSNAFERPRPAPSIKNLVGVDTSPVPFDNNTIGGAS